MLRRMLIMHELSALGTPQVNFTCYRMHYHGIFNSPQKWEMKRPPSFSRSWGRPALVRAIAGLGGAAGLMRASVVAVPPAALAQTVPSGTITVFSGNVPSAEQDTVPQNGSAVATSPIGRPRDGVVDAAGDVFVAGNDNLRAYVIPGLSTTSLPILPGVTLTPGDVYVVAGGGATPVPVSAGSGVPATSAEVFGLQGISVDSSGKLYLANEQTNTVEMVATTTASPFLPGATLTVGDMYDVAGNGTVGKGKPAQYGIGGVATSAALNFPRGVTLDLTGDLVITNSQTPSVLPVAASSCSSACPYGISSMTEGLATATQAKLAYSAASAVIPAGLDKGDLLIADENNYQVRPVTSSTSAPSCLRTPPPSTPLPRPGHPRPLLPRCQAPTPGSPLRAARCGTASLAC